MSLLMKSHFPNLKGPLSYLDSEIFELAQATLLALALGVFGKGVSSIFNPFFFKNVSQSHFLELVWTLLPLSVLLAIITPTFIQLYIQEISSVSELFVKIVAHQWYWSFYYCDLNVEINSYLLDPLEMKNLGSVPLLQTAQAAVVPMNTAVELLLTSSDVLHSWNLPTMGMKSDCFPGLISCINTNFIFPGVYTGMCSELCGAFHTSMPCYIEVVSSPLFLSWLVLAGY